MVARLRFDPFRMVFIEVDFSLTGDRVVRVLSRLAATRGLPQTLKFDNGTAARTGGHLVVGLHHVEVRSWRTPRVRLPQEIGPRATIPTDALRKMLAGLGDHQSG